MYPKSKGKKADKPITHEEAMRQIDSRFGHESAKIAKRNLECMMAWYQREGRFNLPNNRRSTDV